MAGWIHLIVLRNSCFIPAILFPRMLALTIKDKSTRITTKEVQIQLTKQSVIIRITTTIVIPTHNLAHLTWISSRRTLRRHLTLQKIKIKVSLISLIVRMSHAICSITRIRTQVDFQRLSSSLTVKTDTSNLLGKEMQILELLL